jgi:hypothetical protein
VLPDTEKLELMTLALWWSIIILSSSTSAIVITFSAIVTFANLSMIESCGVTSAHSVVRSSLAPLKVEKSTFFQRWYLGYGRSQEGPPDEMELAHEWIKENGKQRENGLRESSMTERLFSKTYPSTRTTTKRATGRAIKIATRRVIVMVTKRATVTRVPCAL